MTLSKALCEKREAQLREWKAQLDRLRARADQAKAQTKITLYREIQDLQSQYDSIREQLSHAKSGTDEAFDDVKSGFSNAWSELKLAFDRAMSRLK